MDIFSTPADVPPPGGVWTPAEHFKRGVGRSENLIEPEFAKFVQVFVDAGFYWGGWFRRTSKPSGQSRGPAGMDTPHLEWRIAPPTLEYGARTLRSGDRGKDVADLNDRLREFGYGIATVDRFDLSTEVAVRAFQTRFDLESDGIVGPLTRAALEANKPAVVPDVRKTDPIEGAKPRGELTASQIAALTKIRSRIEFIENEVPRRLTYIQRRLDQIEGNN